MKSLSLALAGVGADSLGVNDDGPLSVLGFLKARWERHMDRHAEMIYDWAGLTARITKWEDEKLLENPSAKDLAEHKKALEQLIWFGKLVSIGTEQPQFPDKDQAAMVKATLEILELKLAQWHGPQMSKEQSDKIINEVFGES